jgi:hypothetical protein
VWTSGQQARNRLKSGGGSYLSSHDPRIVLGLDESTKLDRLEVHWPQPSTRVDTWVNLPIDRYITIVEGQGIRPA